MDKRDEGTVMFKYVVYNYILEALPQVVGIARREARGRRTLEIAVVINQG